MSALRLCILASAAALLAAPAAAHSYRIELAMPPGGKLLQGHAGVEAADDRTALALVRVVAPGNEVKRRGTVRVLVMNLGATPFEFGPDDVTLTLADGSVLNPVPVAQMEDSRVLIERENQHAAANDLMTRNNLPGLDEQANGGMTPQAMSPGAMTPGSGAAASHDQRTDQSLLPGAQLLDSLYQLLIPLTVEPQKAWGGYYVFDVPKSVSDRKADQPLTILVRTGAQVHRFPAILKWK
jgi:hypothetical protein